MGNSGGGGGPGREWVGSWNLGNWLPGGQRELEATLPETVNVKCLENCGLRCLYIPCYWSPGENGTSVAKMSFKTPP